MKKLLLISSLLFTTPVLAFNLGDFTQTQAGSGIKTVLEQGTKLAVQELGKPGGFNNNPEVRIELPGNIGKAAQALKLAGYGDQVFQLEKGLNQAAEAAIPEAQELLLQAINNLTFNDAKDIVTGSNTAATQYLDRSSRDQLKQRLMPYIEQSVQQVGVAQQYNSLAQQASTIGLLKKQNTSIESYVTDQALDGLFKIIGEKEAALRADPAKAATDAAQKIFNVLQK